MQLHSRYYLSLLLLISLYTGCTTATRPMKEPTGLILETEDFVVLPVYYGTNRNNTGDKEIPKYYGYKYSDTMDFGLGMVSIPREHKLGESESPSMLSSEDPTHHVVLQKVHPLKDGKFFSNLHQETKSRKEILVFVHGFNVTFEDAMRRTAQIAYDLHFKGPVILFSWPSKGDVSPPGYVHDKDIIGVSARQLKEFLKSIAHESDADAIHLVAHSMGNVALARALAEIAQEAGKPVFSEVMMVAPDLNVNEFRNLVRDFQKVAKRITLYASSKDKALMISKEMNGGLRRAGEAGEDIIVISGMDTVDVSNVDTSLVGHTYYGDNNSVISDMIQLLKGLSPSNRSLVARSIKDMKYWVFQNPQVK